jgi:F-type H+-transporting ATPase subunit O
MLARFSRTISVSQRALAPHVRAFSAAKEVTVPLKLYGVEGTYATALFRSASADGTLAAVEKDMKNICGHIATDSSFDTFLRNPTISRAAKKADIEAILGKGKFSKTTVAFFGTLAENGRLPLATKMGSKFNDLMQASRGEVQAVVTSAEDLSAAQLKTLKKSFAGFLQKGETLILETRVDPSILGGLTVQIGDRFMDLSIQSKIQKMHGVLSSSV